ncbi:hypothetical protein MKZ38_003481 [Zalerion maritima]|uniref:Non-structural maintenance of chromosomes element 4 n=1 Tax=Zalerion maritima TaxID=339359 RepID=A0AAD5S4Q4_9PEZI|nr:hypothetical protein MKZ38_003481 [Zalerion maritima]
MSSASSQISDSAGSSPVPSQNSVRIPHRPNTQQQKRRRDTQTGRDVISRRRTASPELERDFGYDPDQPIEERRKLQQGLRNLQDEVLDHAAELAQPTSKGIAQFLEKQNQLSLSVKQTSEALYDSRLLVKVSEIVSKKSYNLTQGGLATGLDLDGFVSKGVTYMRQGRGLGDDDDAPQLSSTQRRRRAGEDDEEADDGDMLKWDHFGQFASHPHVDCSSVPGYLIGPLSVEKKVRRVTQRAARFRPNDLQEVKPQLIQKEDLGRNEKNDLTALCSGILDRLEEHVRNSQDQINEMQDEGYQVEDALESLGMYSEGLDLFRFAINPKSFGQTVENLFYISFLIRDKKVEVDFTEDGFATIFPISERDGDNSDDEEEGPAQKARRQAVFTIDMDIWRDAIDAFGITESIIPHREEKTDHAPGAKGWYG